MAKIFAKRINAGLMTIDSVPSLWKKQVEKMLKEEAQ